MSSRNFLRSTTLLASTRFVEFFVGLIRVKVNALLLGVKGVGIVDQVAFLSQQLATFTTLSMSEGFVKQTSENLSKPDPVISEQLNGVIKAYISVIFIFFSVTSSLSLWFKDELVLYLFSSEQYLVYFYLAVSCVPILLSNGLFFSMLKAFKGTEKIAKSRVLISIINISILLPLVYFFRLDGAVLYILLSYIVTLYFNWYFAKKYYLVKYKITFPSIFKAKVNNEKLKELLTFSGFGMCVGSGLIISEMSIRALIVSNLGVDALGLYAPVVMWGTMFSGVILPTFSTYLYPRFCETRDRNKYQDLINQGIRIATLAMVPFIFLGIPLKEYFISVFYSAEFLESQQFVALHFLGMLFYSWWYVFSQLMTPSGNIKYHGFFMLIMYIINYLVVYFLIDELGLFSYVLKFLISPMIFFVVYFIFFLGKERITLTRHNVVIMLSVVTGFFILYYIDLHFSEWISMLCSLTLVLAILSLLSDEEKLFVRSKIKTALSRE